MRPLSYLYHCPLVFFSLLVFPACGELSPTDDNQDVARENIKAGTPATSYPPSCLVDIYDDHAKLIALCSGALIAPAVVLTAGHCTYGFSHFKVTCPYLSGSATGTGETHPNYHPGTHTILPNSDDVGLVYLQARIAMATYPGVRATPAPPSTQAVNVGRVLDGVVSPSQLYQGAVVLLKDGASISFPHDYYSEDRIQPGDSGGPTYRFHSQPLEILAVNSGAATAFQVLARVDLVAPWIHAKVAAHGGDSLPPSTHIVAPQPPHLTPGRH